MFIPRTRSSTVLEGEAFPQTRVGTQVGSWVQNSPVETQAVGAAPKFQRRLLGIPMSNAANSPLFLNSLRRKLTLAGYTRTDFNELKTFLQRGEMAPFVRGTWGREKPTDTKFRINLAGQEIIQTEIEKVQKTFGLLEGVVDLDLRNNQIEQMPNLQGMTSLLFLKLSNNPLTTIDIATWPPNATVWLDGKFAHSVLTGFFENMQAWHKAGKILPTIIFGDALVAKEAGTQLAPPDGWHFQRVALREHDGGTGACLKISTVESENGEFFVVKPPLDIRPLLPSSIW